MIMKILILHKSNIITKDVTCKKPVEIVSPYNIP